MALAELRARWAAQLPVDSHSDAYHRALVTQRGELEMANLRREVGDAILNEGVSRLHAAHPKQAVVWALGFGSVTGAFVSSPLGSDRASLPEIQAASARINLIVTLYDHLLDSGAVPEETPLVPALIDGFYAQVERWGTSPLGPLLVATIRRMHAAELSGGRSRRDWVRKSALPFVTMGLAAAIAARCPLPPGYLAWLYRMGIWIGWVDDACDIERDRARGHANRLLLEPAPITPPGARVLAWWNAHSNRTDTREVFLYCVKAWLAPNRK